MHELVEYRGVGEGQEAEVLAEFDDVAEAYAVRDGLQRQSLENGRTMIEARYGVRPVAESR